MARAARSAPRNNEIERRDRMIAELRDLITKATSDVSALHSEQAQLRDELRDARETLTTQGGNVGELRQAVDAHAAQLETQSIEVAELGEVRSASQDREHELRRQIDGLRRELDESERSRRSAAAELSDGNAELNSLRNALEESGRESLRRRDEITALFVKIDERDQWIAALVGERDALQQSVGELTERGKAIALEVAHLAEVVAGNEETARAADREISLLRNRIASDEAHSQLRDGEMVALRQTLADLEDGSEEREKARAATEATVAQLEERHVATLGGFDALGESLASAQRTARVEEEQARRLRDGLMAAEQKLADRTREVSELKANLAGARRELEKLEQNVEASTAERLEALRTSIEEAAPKCSAESARPEPIESATAEEAPLEQGPVAEPGLDDQITLLQERLQQREAEIETLGRVLTSSNERNTDLRLEISERSRERARNAGVDELAPVTSVKASEPSPEDPRARERVVGEQRSGWKLFLRNRGRDQTEVTPPRQEPEASPEAPDVVLEPAISGPPTFEVPKDSGAAVSESADRPPIFRYWKRGQIMSKLNRPGIESADDFFLGYLLDLCRRNPGRTNRIVSISNGSHDLEVVLARRALDAGVRNFNIHCLSEVPSKLCTDRAITAERTILANLTLVQCRVETWPVAAPYSLVILNNSLHEFGNPSVWVDRVIAALEPGARVLVHSPIGRHDRGDSALALEIASQIWQLMPEHYKANGSGGGLADCAAGAPASDDEPPTLRSLEILPLLAKHFGFEVFIAFGNVINTFVSGPIARNFDPGSERDRRFIDQIASLDDGKIASGLIAPTHLLAALAQEPLEPIVYEHWTPEFCLARIAESSGEGEPSATPEPSTQAAEARVADTLDSVDSA